MKVVKHFFKAKLNIKIFQQSEQFFQRLLTGVATLFPLKVRDMTLDKSSVPNQ